MKKTCVVCEKLFEPDVLDIRKSEAAMIYCSPTCAWAGPSPNRTAESLKRELDALKQILNPEKV